MTNFPMPPRSMSLDFIAFGVAVATALVVLFVLCWLVAAGLPSLVSASHGWIRLFTTAPESSGRALIEGVIWSIVFGWIIAAVMVPIYNKIVGASAPRAMTTPGGQNSSPPRGSQSGLANL